MKFNYNVAYNKPVDAEWVSRQFKIYDQYVKEYYDPRELLNNFDGTSWDKDGFEEYKIIKLGNLVSLTVDGATTLKNTLSVTGASTLKNTTVGGTLSVTGATTLKNTLTVDGAVTLKNTLGVTGATTLKNTTVGGTLGVTGATTLKNTTVGGTLSVTSDIIIKNIKWSLCKDDKIAKLI